jgi:hypothetical protein
VTNILGLASKSLFHVGAGNASAPLVAAPISDQLQSYSTPIVTTLAKNQVVQLPPSEIALSTSTPDLSEEDERAYFLNDLGVTYIATMTSKNVLDNNTINGMIAALQSIVQIYGTMILPVLYGLLGTIVFEMRKMLNPLRPHTSTIRVIVRTFLGGLTGLIIAFLFKPLHVNYGEGQFAEAPVFLVAFLMGFSIDVFFTMLDALVNVVSRSVTTKVT